MNVLCNVLSRRFSIDWKSTEVCSKTGALSTRKAARLQSSETCRLFDQALTNRSVDAS